MILCGFGRPLQARFASACSAAIYIPITLAFVSQILASTCADFQACLNAPEGFGPDGLPLAGPVAATKAKNGGLAIRPHKLTAAASAAMAASAQAASNAQAEDQHHSNSASDGQNNLGHGTPNSRPKKRLPSGKGKKPQMGENIPPVPQIPDMHRGNSPHNTPTMMSLQSPYGLPHHDPHHHQQQQQYQSPGQFYQPPPQHPHSPGQGQGHGHGQGQGDYGGYYGGHYMMHQQTPQGGPQGQPPQGQMQGGQGGQGAPIYGDSRGRMMMEGGRNLGMGYVGPGGQNE